LPINDNSAKLSEKSPREGKICQKDPPAKRITSSTAKRKLGMA
jgi:hypothetical protein